MIGWLVLARFLFSVTPAGQAIKAVSNATKTCAAFVNETELKILEDEQKKGINSVEELFSESVHGTIEPLFPARIDVEALPGGFENAVGHGVCGEVLWKMSEWNDFWIWVQILLHNSSAAERQPLGRDGLWLVAAGRERWADESMRHKAFATAQKYREIWEPLGMWSGKFPS